MEMEELTDPQRKALEHEEIERAAWLADSYKVSHHPMYPKDTEKFYSYFEARGGYSPVTLFFGLQYFLIRRLEGKLITQAVIDEAEEMLSAHFNNKNVFNKEGWEYIMKEHDGRLPVSIKAVPEGSVVETHNVLVTIEVTDPKCYWLTNFLETILVQAVWYPMTVATLSMNAKKMILGHLEKSGTPEAIDFKLHDFGFRGVSSMESAEIGGAAHLVNFKGTDTMVALPFLRKYYHERMAGFSVPAAEHSTITSWGREHEVEAYEAILDAYPDGPLSIVIDTYDCFNAAEHIFGERLKEKVLARNGMTILRLDSGDPEEVTLKTLGILGRKFGFRENTKGYKVLNDKVRVLWGDGLDLEKADRLLQAMEGAGWSADNMATMGMGGGLLQKVNRDTHKCALKVSSVTRSGVEYDAYKEPVTDPGKVSKKGRFKLLIRADESYETVKETDPGEDQLREVFRDGRVLVDESLEPIRARAKNGLERYMRNDAAEKANVSTVANAHRVIICQ